MRTMIPKQVLFVGAPALTMIPDLSGCANPNSPAQPAVGAPPPPPRQARDPAATGNSLFAPTPGSAVQSPGGFVPIPGGSPYQGN
jgi:hypothetical protein